MIRNHNITKFLAQNFTKSTEKILPHLKRHCLAQLLQRLIILKKQWQDLIQYIRWIQRTAMFTGKEHIVNI